MATCKLVNYSRQLLQVHNLSDLDNGFTKRAFHKWLAISETYSESNRISKIKLFARIANNF